MKNITYIKFLLVLLISFQGAPTLAQTPIRGYADIHNHQFANLAFGKRVCVGSPYGPIDIALPWCTWAHGAGGVLDTIDHLRAKRAGHLVGGYPQFDGWPRHDSYTHQTVYQEWLKRAHQGGLQLMVMLAVNNEGLCNLQTPLNFDYSLCNDMVAADLQIEGAKAMEAYIEQNDGGWFKIVYSAEEARTAIGQGKLAVVLGVEVDFLFNCKREADCNQTIVSSQLDVLYDKGVRHIIPIHLYDNAFGGSALYSDTNSIIFNTASAQGLFTLPEYVIPATRLEAGYDWLLNAAGLTNLGRYFMGEIMDKGMILDIDHMSTRSKADIFPIASSRNYPLLASHTGFLDQHSAGNVKRNEYNLSDEEMANISNSGGLVAPILMLEENLAIPYSGEEPCKGSAEAFVKAYRYALARMGPDQIAFGSDFNSGAGLPKPRFGADGCYPDNDSMVSYPFTSKVNGAVFNRHAAGFKVFDINIDGLSNIGLLPDFIEELSMLGLSDQELQPLFNSAEGYIRSWERSTISATQHTNSAPLADAGPDQLVECSGISTSVTLDASGTVDPDGDTPLSYEWTGNIPGVFGTSVNLDFPLGTHTMEVFVTDPDGSVGIDSTQIVVQDSSPPTLIFDAAVAIEASTVGGTSFNVTASASDVCDPSDPTLSNDAPLIFPIGVTTVTWITSDSNGNVTSEAQTITVQDTISPELSVPADISIEANGSPSSLVSLGTATATDLFEPVAISNDAPAEFPLGVTMVNWTATDANGNAVSAVQAVTIQDTTEPVLSIPADIAAEATSNSGDAVDIGNATAVDLFEPIAISNNAPTSFALGSTTVTWTATDANGNIAVANQVVVMSDTTVPVLTVPLDITSEANANPLSIVSIGDATATDIFSSSISNDSPPSFPLGTTIVNWTATDVNGNAVSASQTVTVRDTTPPSLTVPTDNIVEANGSPNSTVDVGLASAADLFDVAISNDAPSNFPIGTTTVTWLARDSNDNTASLSQLVTVQDTTAPVLNVPAAITMEASANPFSILNIGSANATDLFEVSISSDAPAEFPLGATTVNWTATDANGNAVSATQTVTIQDTTEPVLSIPADITVEASSDMGNAVDIGSATATDLFEPISITNNAPTSFALGSTTVTWTATDANGNIATADQVVAIADTTAPALTVPIDITSEANANPLSLVSIGDATAIDIFSSSISNDAPSSFPLGTTIVNWTATDVNGNSVSQPQTVTVEDSTAPVVTVPDNLTIEASDSAGSIVNIGSAMATDLFEPVVISNNAPANFQLGGTTVTWTATDTNGNTTAKDQIVTVVDSTPPVITAPTSINAEANGNPTSELQIGLATATDIFDITLSNDAPATFPLGTSLVTWTAEDANGNSATATQAISVEDSIDPELMVPADITVVATGASTLVAIGSASATDLFAPVAITNDAPVFFGVGNTAVNWQATDTNGNTSSEVQQVTVSYIFGGFQAPLRDGGVFKLGRTIPIKIVLDYLDGTPITNAQPTIAYIQRLDGNDVTGDPIDVQSTSGADSGSQMRYSGGTYKYNLATNYLAKGRYRLAIDLLDGSLPRTIDIAFK